MSTPLAKPELCSWKEISAYLGVSVKTAQLWEQQRGMPVRRLPGVRGQVRVVISELESWKVSGAAPDPNVVIVSAPSKWGWISIGLVIGVLSALVILLTAGKFIQPDVASVRVKSDALIGLDQRVSLLWRHQFGSLDSLAYTQSEQRYWVGDLDGDGKNEILFVPIPNGLAQIGIPLVCLDNTGRELWRYKPGKEIRRANQPLDPIYLVRRFAIIGNKIVVTSHHHDDSPAQVSVLDSQGKLLREYWHPGHLNSLTTGEFRGKPVAYLGGINNSRHAATLLVLDAERLAGAAVESGRPSFDGMQAGVEEMRMVFPRSCLNRGYPYNAVVHLFAHAGKLTVHVAEKLEAESQPTIHYHFSEDLALTGVSLTDTFLTKHAELAGHTLSEAEKAEFEKITFVRPVR